MKLRKLSLLFIAMFLSICSFAQTEECIDEIKEQYVVINNDSLKNIIIEQENEISKLKQSIEFLKTGFEIEIDSLKKVVAEREDKILKFNQYVAVADTCILKLCNRDLQLPFNKKRISNSISYFEKIYSKELKLQYFMLLELLKDYEKSYNDFKNIIKEAQNDIDRENVFADNSYKQKYIYEIQNMEYCKKYAGSKFKIVYLQEQIDKVLKILEKHSGKSFADFKHIIDTF